MNKFKYEIFGVIYTTSLLSLWYFSSLAIDNQVVPSSYGLFFDLFAYSLSAFIGAYSAFLLKSLSDKNEIRDKNVKALNDAIFKLGTIQSRVFDVVKDLDDLKDDPGRYISLQPFIPVPIDSHSIDHSSLLFLAKSNNPNILSHIALIEDKLTYFLSLVKDRAIFHHDYYQQAASNLGIPDDFSTTEQDMIEKFGKFIILGLKTRTDAIYTMQEGLIEETSKLTSELHRVGKLMYPNELILNYKLNIKA